MADTPQTHDLTAILEAFSKEDLAAFMARHAYAQPGQSATVSLSALRRTDSPAPLVARVEGVTGTYEGDTFTVTAREHSREDGYYIVYDAEFARDRVSYWSSADGQWFTTDDKASTDQAPLSIMRPVELPAAAADTPAADNALETPAAETFPEVTLPDATDAKLPANVGPVAPSKGGAARG